MITQELIDSIKLGEGFSRTGYRCSLDKLTLGFGRCIDPDVPGAGITEEEAEYLLTNDIERFEEAAERVVGSEVWSWLSQRRRGVALAERVAAERPPSLSPPLAGPGLGAPATSHRPLHRVSSHNAPAFRRLTSTPVIPLSASPRVASPHSAMGGVTEPRTACRSTALHTGGGFWEGIKGRLGRFGGAYVLLQL